MSACRPAVPQSVEVFVLMYHDIRDEAVEGNSAIISTEAFRIQMQTLQDAGFEAVSFCDLIAFVDESRPLPPNPIVITFDDGYRSNLELAAPILEEFGKNAIVNVIGISRGRDTYRHTDIPIIPHFSWYEVRPWVERGVIQIGHHSYDMHRWHESPDEPWRDGVLPMENEGEQEYREALSADFERLRQIVATELGKEVLVYAYPYGLYNEQAEEILRDLGVRVTLTTHKGLNLIERGNQESLFLLNRISMTEDLCAETLIEHLESFRAEPE
jgi:peptidoglycan/xylan/chitin deacetylase (PgdA/CDA1 family)